MSHADREDVQPPGFLVRHDCRHFTGYRPCDRHPVCQGCEQYEPVGERILIIKLGAMGDVLRTTPVLPALRRRWPDAHVTWVTRAESRDLLRNNPLIDRLLVWGHDATVLLEALSFDLVLNFEKDLAALALGERVQARERRGFRLSTAGTVGIADERAGYALRLGLDDDLKFQRNTASHQQMICEMVGLRWGSERYVFEPSAAARTQCDALRREHPALAGKTLIGISTGCGAAFPTKRWGIDNVVDLLRHLAQRPDTVALLLGSARDREFNRDVLRRGGAGVIDTGCDHSLDVFVGLLLACDAVVSADSLPMHLAVALERPVVALFGPTSPREVDLGPLSEKVVTDFECGPCYRTACDKSPLCMEAMGAERVLEALERALAGA